MVKLRVNGTRAGPISEAVELGEVGSKVEGRDEEEEVTRVLMVELQY